MTDAVPPPRRNVVPGAYRGVAVTTVGPARSTTAPWPRYFLGREAYRRTRFIVVRNGGAHGDRRGAEGVRRSRCSPPITRCRLLVGPDDCAYLRGPRGRHRGPVRAGPRGRGRTPAASAASWSQGRYGHVSFILDPAPAPDHGPRGGAALPGEAARPGAARARLAEDLPPIELVPDVRRARRPGPDPARRQLPAAVPRRRRRRSTGASTDYLDERPERRDWTLIGCERSQQIHEWFYGERAPQVDICPRKRPGGTGAAADQVLPARDRTSRSTDGRVVVPWGASLAQISEALTALIAADVGADVGTRLSDSQQYAHLWGTPETRAALRGTRPAAELAGHPRRAGRGPGPTRHHPGRGGRSRSPSTPAPSRSTWSSSPSRPGGRRTRCWA